MTTRREHAAWLLWKINQGYLKAEDRALGMKPEEFIHEMSQHEDDRAELPHWLVLADELIAAFDTEVADRV